MSVYVGPLSDFTGLRYTVSWRSYRNPVLHGQIVLFKHPSELDEPIPRWYGMTNECPHLGAPLEQAPLEIEDASDSLVVICPWHLYDYDLRTGESQASGLRACTYKVEVKDGALYCEPPGDFSDDWRVLGYRQVSEKFAEEPTSQLSLPPTYSPLTPPPSLVSFCRLILLTPDPLQKVALTRTLVHLFRTGNSNALRITHPSDLPPPDKPPRLPSTKLVQSGQTAKRGKGGTVENRAKLLHALCWIELWAIDLALDVMARFAMWRLGSLDGKSGEGKLMKEDKSFFSDFLRVAEDEAKHFTILKKRMEEMGDGSYTFGCWPVHDGLWESATQTSHSLFSRLAIVHLVGEARGLDVNPLQIKRAENSGDLETAEVLKVVHNDEITHVSAGHRYFQLLCHEAGLDPITQFRKEVGEHFWGKLKGPFNEEDRRKGGLEKEWYEDLAGRHSHSTSADKVADVITS